MEIDLRQHYINLDGKVSLSPLSSQLSSYTPPKDDNTNTSIGTTTPITLPSTPIVNLGFPKPTKVDGSITAQFEPNLIKPPTTTNSEETITPTTSGMFGGDIGGRSAEATPEMIAEQKPTIKDYLIKYKVPIIVVASIVGGIFLSKKIKFK